MWLWVTISAVTLAMHMVCSQTPTRRNFTGDCSRITPIELGIVKGRTSSNGLISLALFDVSRGIVDDPVLNILQYKVVCESAGLRINTTSSFSIIVLYDCHATICGGPNVNQMDQFQFDCNRQLASFGSFLPPAIHHGSILTDVNSSIGNFETPLNTQCGLCVDPTTSEIAADPHTHCVCMSISQYSGILYTKGIFCSKLHFMYGVLIVTVYVLLFVNF